MKRETRRRRWTSALGSGAVLIAVLLFLAAAPVAVAPRDPAPGEVGAGELLWNDGETWRSLPVLEVRAELTVTGAMIRGRIVQTFRNATGDTIETLYVFPLPDGAAVHAMEMRIGDRRVVAEIRERERARKEYDRARVTGRKSALVEQQRPNLFTTFVANVNPGERVEVRLEYVEQAAFRPGRFGLRVPLTYTPRFVPDRAGAEVERLARIQGPFLSPTDPEVPRADIEVRIEPGFPVASVHSDSHDVEVLRDRSGWTVRTADGGVPADRDFVLAWEPEPGRGTVPSVFVETTELGQYALVTLVPSVPRGDTDFGLPTETLFIVDVSGSMKGPSIRQARQALLAALDRLRPEDRFNLLRFNDVSESFRRDFQQADPGSLEAARDWVRDLRADGGTMIGPALARGLAMAGEARFSIHVQRIVFLTDGAVGNEQAVLREVRERSAALRIHAIGVGDAPNTYFVRKLASIGRGLCAFVPVGESAANGIDEFFRRLDRPVLADPVISWDGVEIEDVFPDELSDLHAGEPIVISARLTGGDARGRVRLGGYVRNGWVETSAELSDAASGSGIVTRWARAKVESLMDAIQEGADPGTIRPQVVDLALAHHLVTAYTSLIAVEEAPTAVGEVTAVRVGNALPRGGTFDPLLRRAGVALAVCGGLLFLFATRRQPA